MRFPALPGQHRAALVLGLVAVGAVVGGCGSPTPEITVILTEFTYEPSRIVIGRNQKTLLKLENKGAEDHALLVQQINVKSPTVSPGKTVTLEVTAPRGPLKIVCTIPGHEAAGMVGELAVEARR